MWTFVDYKLDEKHGHLIFGDHLIDLVFHFESHGFNSVCSLSLLCEVVSHKDWDIWVEFMKSDVGIL